MENEETKIGDSLGINIRKIFEQSKQERLGFEQRWIEDLQQFKGIYPSDVKIADNRSQAFIRLTRTKVKTMDARMGDMLFPAGSQKNWSIRPTPIPEIPENVKNKIVYALISNGVEPSEEKVNEVVSDYAKNTCKNMEREIDDQLKEAKYSQVCREVIHDGNLYGTGVLKGPMVEMKEQHRWKMIGENEFEIDSVIDKKPYYERVSLYDVYPDMSARTIDEAEYVSQRHMMTKSDLRRLAERQDFDGKKNS